MSLEPQSPSTAITTPSTDDSDDIWEDSGLDSRREEVLSDLPARKRQQMNDGYRDGLSIGKARVMQSGFDKGYPIGVQIGLRVGSILGVLEGWMACKSIDTVPSTREKVKTTYMAAVEALGITELLKNSNEEALMEATTISGPALAIIEYWESKGVYS